MVDNHEGTLDRVQDIFVFGNVLTGKILVRAVDCEAGVFQDLPDLAGALEALDGDFLVRGAGEPVRVDDGRVTDLAGANGECCRDSEA